MSYSPVLMFEIDVAGSDVCTVVVVILGYVSVNVLIINV